MEAVTGTAEALLLVMLEIIGLIEKLITSSREKESFLAASDIGGLNSSLEKEEELVFELSMKEEERIRLAKTLASEAGVKSAMPRLKELIGFVDDPYCRERLVNAGNAITEMIKKLSFQNSKNKVILEYQMNYTEFMLNLLLVPRSRGNFYNDQGYREEPGNLSVLDCHI